MAGGESNKCPMELASWQDYATHAESMAPEFWDGCVGLWAPLLGPTGDVLIELSGHSPDLAVDTSSVWGAGVVGAHIDISGNDGRCFNAGIDSTHPLTGSDHFTMTAVCSDQTYAFSEGIFSFRNADNVSGLILLYPFDSSGGDGFRVFFDGASSDTNEQDAPAGRANGMPRVFTFTYDGTNERGYVEGNIIDTTATTKTLTSTPDFIEIGRWRPGQQIFNGEIQLCGMWDRVMSASEVFDFSSRYLQMLLPAWRSSKGRVPAVAGTILPQVIQQGLYAGSAA